MYDLLIQAQAHDIAQDFVNHKADVTMYVIHAEV